MSQDSNVSIELIDPGDEWVATVQCDFCPYCGKKKEDSGSVELHVFSDAKSVVFHNPEVDPNSICEIPDSMG